MSLISEINNTNTQKENIKTVANNIDNKLVELGGEQAINLADVPNKIDETIKNNLRKSAVIDLGGMKVEGSEKYKRDFSDVLDFIPQNAILDFELTGNEPYANGSSKLVKFYTNYSVKMEQGKTTTLAVQTMRSYSYSNRIEYMRPTFKLSNKAIEFDDVNNTYWGYYINLNKVTFIE